MFFLEKYVTFKEEKEIFIKLWRKIMPTLKVAFAKTQSSQYFSENVINMNETPKLDAVSILEKYEYDLSDIIEESTEETND